MEKSLNFILRFLYEPCDELITTMSSSTLDVCFSGHPPRNPTVATIQQQPVPAVSSPTHGADQPKKVNVGIKKNTKEQLFNSSWPDTLFLVSSLG